MKCELVRRESVRISLGRYDGQVCDDHNVRTSLGRYDVPVRCEPVGTSFGRYEVRACEDLVVGTSLGRYDVRACAVIPVDSTMPSSTTTSSNDSCCRLSADRSQNGLSSLMRCSIMTGQTMNSLSSTSAASPSIRSYW